MEIFLGKCSRVPRFDWSYISYDRSSDGDDEASGDEEEFLSRHGNAIVVNLIRESLSLWEPSIVRYRSENFNRLLRFLVNR